MEKQGIQPNRPISAKIRLENISYLSGLQDEFPAQQNRELILDNRELIPPYQAGTGNCLKIDPLAAMKHLFPRCRLR